MSISPISSILYSELVLSLYPILIKTVDTNLFTQVLARFIVFPALAIAFGSTRDFRSIWSSPYEIFTGILTSLLNMGHIAVSYLSFKALPAGTAISLFYMYPIFNVIMGSILFGESITPLFIGLVMIAFIGVYLIATSHNKEKEKEKEDDSSSSTKYSFGVLMGLLAAFTETLIFVFIRSSKEAQQSPFYTVNHLYPFGFIVLGLYSFFNKSIVDVSSSTNWMKLIGFNAVLGFTGYLARFYAIPKIPTIVFSLLSFIGVLFGYIWGILFTDDKPSISSIIGGILIAGSIGVLRYFESA
jgi:drug/metabolite transporter (DMT)-like permease